MESIKQELNRVFIACCVIICKKTRGQSYLLFPLLISWIWHLVVGCNVLGFNRLLWIICSRISLQFLWRLSRAMMISFTHLQHAILYIISILPYQFESALVTSQLIKIICIPFNQFGNKVIRHKCICLVKIVKNI